MGFTPRDFESRASASSATSAFDSAKYMRNWRFRQWRFETINRLTTPSGTVWTRVT